MALIFWISERSCGSGVWAEVDEARIRMIVASRADFIGASLSIDDGAAALYSRPRSGWD